MLGKLRFQAPTPPTQLHGIQLADTLPDQCIQSTEGLAPVDPSWVTGLKKRATLPPQSEDCLFVEYAFFSSSFEGRSLIVF